jgi:hypothetical protein
VSVGIIKVYSSKTLCEPGSSVSIVSGYGLDDQAIGVRSPAEAKGFFSSFCVQTGSGAHPASCLVGTGGSFPGAKVRPGCDTNHSPHLVPRSRMSRSYTSPPSAFMACSGTALALAIRLYDGFWLLRRGRENREVGGAPQ